ncbi:MAG: hypothetical protein F6K50_42125 [Moorea sp. SIO3I7]|uniref:hypothetical protein n=1 Tax=unclassified Moorena TaxID=2683338 RepID=UPI0013BF9082|nr:MULTISPECIES: hypothetical protein [unclassified Moorena]NEO01755.1 hypothetical protein [Moorena sp. SIO3I7]NEO08359.1 hypothetical protein [Moorena sp. SIO3I8]NEP24630.1 hypothetical protein [Moorena sp. SIO3I6]
MINNCSIVINPWWAVPRNPMASTSICLMHCPPYICSIVINPWWAVPRNLMVSTSICLMQCLPYIYYYCD